MDLILAGNISQFPKNNKQDISIIGRSNAGKSTLINAIIKQKVAHTSKTPGKTKTINFYDQKKYYLVDMPGYGYSKNSIQKNQEISNLITSYFSNRKELLGIIHICSVMELTEQDLEMIMFLTTMRSNYLLVLNKSDKISKQKQFNTVRETIKKTNLPENQILLISAKNSNNINLLMRQINIWISLNITN